MEQQRAATGRAPGRRSSTASTRRRPARRPRRGDSKRRLLFVLALTMVAFLAISGRLIVLQVLDAPSLDEAAAKQRLRTIELPGERGRIFDRDGGDLALSVPARTVYAQPRLIGDPAGTARKLAPLLGQPAKTVLGRLRSGAAWTYLARKIPVANGQAVAKLDLPGIGVLTDTMRRYPSGQLASQVLGFVGTDGSGLAGVEQRYDGLLAGHSGQMLLEQDPSGRPIPQGQRSIEPARPGSDLVLTIDQNIQYVAERALAAAVEQYQAKSDAVVVRKSTKVTVPPELPLCPGVHPFHDSHQHGTERLTFADVVAQSSNIGTIRVATKLGPERLAKAELDFGYGQRTGVDLPGETPGIVRPQRTWTCSDLGTNAIGQGVAVSVLQMARVYASVANGGLLVQPTLLRGTVDERGDYHATERPTPKRVLSVRTTQTLTTILEGVVREGGTGTRAALDDWTVAGKTGTAQVPNPNGGGYLPGAHVASFMGYAPAEDPRVVVAVVLDRPTKGIYGGTVAAPVFREVAGYALRHMEVPPSLGGGDATAGGEPGAPAVPDGDVGGSTPPARQPGGTP